MSEKTDDDGWEKVREMIRNAPPPTGAVPFQPDQPHPEPPKRSHLGKLLLIILVIGAVAVGAYLWTQRDEAPESKSGASRATSPATAVTPPAAVPQPASDPAPGPTTTVTVRKGLKSVNVRSSPSAGSAQVGRIAGGQQVERLSESGEWVQVRFAADGKQVEGWVRNDMLQK